MFDYDAKEPLGWRTKKLWTSGSANCVLSLPWFIYCHMLTHVIAFDIAIDIICFSGLVCRGGVLEDTFWSPWPWPRRSSPWPWPRSLKSSKIALSSARGQHYFLSSWNFVGKRQKPRRKFASTFFVFLSWSMGVAKGRRTGGPPPPQLKFHQWQKCDKKAYSFFSFSFFLAFFAYNSITNNNIDDQGSRCPSIQFLPANLNV